MEELSVGMKNCLGHKAVPNFPSLASSFLSSMSYTECLKDKMFSEWGKLDAPIKGERQQPPCGGTTMSRDGGSLLLGMDPGIFQLWTNAHPGGHWVHITHIQLATKVSRALPGSSLHSQHSMDPTAPNITFLSIA